MSDWWIDPIVWLAFGLGSLVLLIVGALSAAIHAGIERLDRRVPWYRQPLEAGSARFHRILLAVRRAAVHSRE